MTNSILFDLAIHETIAKLDDVFVTHSSMDHALNGLAECISWSAKSREPKGAILTGLGGAGKTTICNVILKRLPPVDLEEGDQTIRTVPAFYTSVPAPSSIRSLASRMLEQLNDPAPDRGTAYQLTRRLAKLLKNCKTRVILLDEFHNLLASKGPASESKMLEICNWLRGVMNETRVMICLVGTPQCANLIDYDVQISRRFSHHFPLHDLSCGSESEPGSLVGFVDALCQRYVDVLSLKSFPRFDDYEACLRLWVATQGRPAYITLLLQTAIKIALHDAKRDHVMVQDLADAFDRGITAGVAKTHRNPFTMSSASLTQTVLSKTGS
jgi:hypothetical protein